ELFNNGLGLSKLPQEPIVMGDGAYLLAYQYGSPALAERSFYVMGDPRWKDIAPDALFKQYFFRAFLAMLPPGRMHAPEYESFLREHSHFLLYDPDPWLVERLLADGEEVTVKKLGAAGPLYAVSIR